jgi:aldehyde:ferredoxin oxidoreductase
MEAKLLESVTGLEMDEAELDLTGEAIFNLERALSIREGRTINDDLSVISSLENAGDWSRGIKLDVQRYRGLLRRYYLDRGWDPNTGEPTDNKLQKLGLTYVTEGLDRKAEGPDSV